ncbi:MAG TPA: hypothetical protein VK427_24295, partial [Kofleriaceae bacterium]|nr:hypothetical protein [Kofleriaceae bacterium]
VDLTAEAILYTPEMMYHFVDNAGEIYDKLSSMSVKDIALAYLSNDATTKQAVLAARIKKKLDKAGIKRADGKKGEMPSEEELAFLGEQSAEAIRAAMELHDRMEKLGLLPEESGVPPKGTKIKPEELQTKMAAIEAGFTEFANAYEEQQANPNDAAAKQRTAEQAEKFRKSVAAHIKAGATSLPREAERKTDKDLPDGQKQEEIDEKELSRVDNLPTPGPDSLAEVQAMFSQSKEGLDQTREAYLIQKFAFLTTPQLADLIENDQVSITDKAGQSRVLPLWPSERPFAIALFKQRVDKAGTLFKKADPTATPATDKDMVTAWRRREQKQADAEKKDAKNAKKAKKAKKAAQADAAAGKGKGKAKVDDGAGAGAGGLESLDEALWGEEPEDEGFGDSGQGLDADGDGKLSKQELEGKKQPATNGKDETLNDGVKPKGGKNDKGSRGDTSFRRLIEPVDKYAAWNPETKEVVPKRGADFAGLRKWRPYVKEGVKTEARIENVEILNRGNTAVDGETPKYEFAIKLTLFVDFFGEDVEYLNYYYDPDAGRVTSLTGDPERVRAELQKAFAIKDGAVSMTGAPMKIFGATLLAKHVERMPARDTKTGERVYPFVGVMKLQALDHPTSILNADGKRQELDDVGEEIRLLLDLRSKTPG